MPSQSTCSVDGCERPTEARGWCNAHYLRWRNHGNVFPGQPITGTGRDAIRFWAKVAFSDETECWYWTASFNRDGYGQFKILGSYEGAHRWAWECCNGPVPEGMELDHLCRNRRCVRPDHLDAVTHRENCRRGSRGLLRSPAEQCVRGHEFTPINTRLSQRERICRSCARERNRAWRAAQKHA